MKRTTKVELVSAVAMLLVAAIMMTSASFAWFTLSTTPQVEGIELNLGVSKNFEIARVDVDGTSWKLPDEVTSNDALELTDKTWGSNVSTFPGISADAKINYGIHIAQASDPNAEAGTFDGGELTQIAYNEDGRTSGAYIKLNTSTGAIVNGVQTMTALVYRKVTGSAVTKNVAMGYGIWLRSNTTISALKVTATTSSAYATYSGDKHEYLPTTTGAVGTTGGVKAGDAINVSVRLFKVKPATNSIDSWEKIEAAKVETTDTATSGHYPYISLNGDGVEVDLTSYAGFEMKPNETYLAIIVVSVNGEYIYARSFTEGAGMTFGGYSIKFETPQVPEE